ncbi:MAG: VOC family protein [Fidelibacterota bacterium]
MGFEVDDIRNSNKKIQSSGWKMEHEVHEEPWGQLTTIFFSPEGTLIEITNTPGARVIVENVKAINE